MSATLTPIERDVLQSLAMLALNAQALQPDKNDLEATIQRLHAALDPVLPKKADGTPFTPEETHAAAQRIIETAQEIIDRDGTPGA